METGKESFQLNHHLHLALILFYFIFDWLSPLSSLTVLLHFHFWHLLKTCVKLAGGRTESRTGNTIYLSKYVATSTPKSNGVISVSFIVKYIEQEV